MATEFLRAESGPANITLHEIHLVARALKRLHVIDSAPVLTVEDRAEIYQAKRACWSVVGGAAEALVSLMDAIAGDPDIELNGDESDGTFAEDEPAARFACMGNGPGCSIADPDRGVDDDPEGVDEGI